MVVPPAKSRQWFICIACRLLMGGPRPGCRPGTLYLLVIRDRGGVVSFVENT